MASRLRKKLTLRTLLKKLLPLLPLQKLLKRLPLLNNSAEFRFIV